MFMDENAPPTYFGINNHRNRYLSQSKSYVLFDIKKNRFYNSSMSKNKINSSIEKNRKKYKINEEEKEQYKTQIAINTKKLELLEHKYLIELIQLIEYTCDLSLNDYRYEDKTYSIFKIIKNKEKKGYDIIINDNNDEKIQKKEDYKRDEIEDDKFYDNEDEEDKEEEKEEEEEEEEEYDDNNSMKDGAQYENFFIQKNQLKNVFNFKTINLDYKEKQNNIKNNIKEGNKINDFYKTYTNFREKSNIFEDKNTINNNSIFNNLSPISKKINDSQSEDEYYEEREEEKKEIKIHKNNMNYIKCTDCDLVYNTKEQMKEHYYNIHDKNKIKCQIKTKIETEKCNKKELNQNFEQWVEKRKIIKTNNNEKNINFQNKNNKKLNKNYLNKNDLNQKKNKNKKEKIIDEEEEKINAKYSSDIEKILEMKAIKIRDKMKKISNQRKKLIANVEKGKNINNQEYLSKKYEEIREIIKERREEAIQKIRKETRDKIKELNIEKKKKLREIKLNKQKEKNLKQQEEERKKLEEINKKEEENRKLKLERIKQEEIERKRLEEKNKRKVEEEKGSKIEEEKTRQNDLKKKDELKRKEEIRKIQSTKRLMEEKRNSEESKSKEEMKSQKTDLFKNNNRNEEKKVIINDINHFYCNLCNRGFNSQEALLSHKKNSFKHKIITGNFLCGICKRKFNSISALENHERSKQHFQCNICWKTFSSKMAINNHCKDLNHNSIFMDN